MTQHHTFCTYFDGHYLDRALALYNSLARFTPAFTLWALCLDDHAVTTLATLSLAHLRTVRVSELETFEPGLREARTNRTQVEYYFTCTPVLPLYVLQRDRDIGQITYLDADLCFFDDAQAIFDAVGGASIGIVPHDYSPRNASKIAWGKFNVGVVVFRRDEQGLACLEWWRDRCLEWCYDILESDRFADQKYLDAWPSLFDRVEIIRHEGVNLAPWNVSARTLSLREGKVFVDGVRLVCYHFQGLKRVGPHIFDSRLRRYHARLRGILRRELYLPYCSVLLEGSRHLPAPRETALREQPGRAAAPPGWWHAGAARAPRDLAARSLKALRGDYVYVP
jgi:hypothetical protein